MALAALALAACGPPEQAEPPPDPAAAAQVGPAEPLPRSLPPPSDERPRYVGLWAASAEGCADPAWRFQERRITTQGEVSCDFNSVTLTQSGYRIAAMCTAEAPPRPYEIELSFAESARAMMVSGGPWSGDIGLTYCGSEQR